MERNVYIYKIINKINNKVYVGQSISPKHRWQAHKRSVNKPIQVIHHALIKYGIDNFAYEIIACCFGFDAANEAETTIVKQEKSLVPNGYNVSNGGFNAPKTEEWKKKVIATRKAKDNYKHSEDTKRKIALANAGKNYHGPLKLGHNIRNTGKTRFKPNQVFPNTGSKMPGHVKQKLLEANIGRILSEEHREKLSKVRKGKVHSGSFKAGISSHNKTNFTEQQIIEIKNDLRSLVAIANELGVTAKVISRVKKAI